MPLNNPLATQVLHRIQRAAGILVLGTISIQTLGFVKSLFIAAYYGTSAELDAYMLALAPLRLVSGVLLGAIQAALIPRYLELRTNKGANYAISFFLSCVGLILAAIFFMNTGIFFGSSKLTTLLAPGFSFHQAQLTAFLLKWGALYLVFIVLAEPGVSLFQAHRQFFMAAVLPLLTGIVSFGYIIFFRHQGVPSLLYGLILGLALQTLVTLYIWRAWRTGPIRFFSPKHPEIRKTITNMAPLLLGASFGHVNMLVDQMMASTLPAGSIAALNYAAKLHKTMTMLFITVVAQAVFPFFAQQAAERDVQALKSTFSVTLKRLLALLLPLTVLILFLGTPIIRLLFQRGAFSTQSTLATSGAWKAYTLGLPIQAVRHFTIRLFNALQDNMPLMYLEALSIVLNILLNVLFMRWWGHIGIALSTACVYWLTTGVLLYQLYLKQGVIK